MKRPSSRDRILTRICEHSGCTNNALLSADLKLKREVVDTLVDKLIQEGRIERETDPEPGYGPSLSPTVLTLNERDEEARFRRNFPSTRKAAAT